MTEDEAVPANPDNEYGMDKKHLLEKLYAEWGTRFQNL